MAHLGSTFTSFEVFLDRFADQYFTVDLTALNNSTVSGTAVIGYDMDPMSVDGDGRYINVAIVANNLTPDQLHPQHIHGAFAEGPGGSTPEDSFLPTLDADTDRDGFIEVLEGVPAYGDVILPLTSPPGNAPGGFPTADAQGNVVFLQSYNLDENENFFSGTTGISYDGDDVLPLELREIVLHGLAIPAGYGQGTEGEVNGMGGYITRLPAAAGEIVEVDREQAFDVLEDQRQEASTTFVGDDGNNRFDGGPGDDTAFGGAGNDVLIGGGDMDLLYGQGGNDFLYGGADDDRLFGNDGDDALYGQGGDDALGGGAGNDRAFGGEGNDRVFGNDGNDTVAGEAGDDLVVGGAGNDRVFGGAGDDEVRGGAGDDFVAGGAGNDLVFGEAGDDRLFGGSGDDLIVGGAGRDGLRGGDGLDILGGGGGNDILTGGAGADEFHFDAGTGTDFLIDFTADSGDVISFLDGGAIEFANSSENATRGDSDLSALDYVERATVADIQAGDDQKVVEIQSSLTAMEILTMTGASAEAYVVVYNADRGNGQVLYDDDWSTAGGRELIANLEAVETLADVTALTNMDFDVY